MSDVIFSHVEAIYVTTIYCPDCETKGIKFVLFINDDEALECSCGALFKQPRVTLERLPPEDYTHTPDLKDKTDG